MPNNKLLDKFMLIIVSSCGLKDSFELFSITFNCIFLFIPKIFVVKLSLSCELVDKR